MPGILCPNHHIHCQSEDMLANYGKTVSGNLSRVRFSILELLFSVYPEAGLYCFLSLVCFLIYFGIKVNTQHGFAFIACVYHVEGSSIPHKELEPGLPEAWPPLRSRLSCWCGKCIASFTL